MEPYSINLDIKYEHLQIIDVPDIILSNKEQWFNQTLTQVNGSVVRLGIILGEFHWHKHENEDEFFFVLSGRLFIDLEDKTIILDRNQGVAISKGILHRPRAPKKVVMLMVETADIKPMGDGTDWIDHVKQKHVVTYPVGISLDTHLRELHKLEGLSVRSINGCLNQDLRTLGDLIEFYKDKSRDFALIRNLGVKSDRELSFLCEKYLNYDFPQETIQ
jgi:mannose-6-phosphate isomerase-like protein (cupin superfamily)